MTQQTSIERVGKPDEDLERMINFNRTQQTSIERVEMADMSSKDSKDHKIETPQKIKEEEMNAYDDQLDSDENAYRNKTL